MITRIVKMTFREEETENFTEIFKETSEFIRSSNGCLEVKLMRDISNANVFFTLSKWQSEEHLNIYRCSDLFMTTWARVKPLFSEKAQAWSVEEFF
ncbi:MAG: antibiotic biosynthesis monooxygenase family protein [Daejeonella sp.]|uniref:putative quinol monooxygenase n=1 Tax=Daejeonella sp. TaxID=2805397 RepID=UPI003C75D44A